MEKRTKLECFEGLMKEVFEGTLKEHFVKKP